MNFYVIWGKNMKFIKLYKHDLKSPKSWLDETTKTNKQQTVYMAKPIINEAERVINWSGGGEGQNTI